jgi:hypothetical protein
MFVHEEDIIFAAQDLEEWLDDTLSVEMRIMP